MSALRGSHADRSRVPCCSPQPLRCTGLDGMHLERSHATSNGRRQLELRRCWRSRGMPSRAVMQHLAAPRPDAQEAGMGAACRARSAGSALWTARYLLTLRVAITSGFFLPAICAQAGGGACQDIRGRDSGTLQDALQCTAKGGRRARPPAARGRWHGSWGVQACRWCKMGTAAQARAAVQTQLCEMAAR